MARMLVNGDVIGEPIDQFVDKTSDTEKMTGPIVFSGDSTKAVIRPAEIPENVSYFKIHNKRISMEEGLPSGITLSTAGSSWNGSQVMMEPRINGGNIAKFGINAKNIRAYHGYCLNAAVASLGAAENPVDYKLSTTSAAPEVAQPVVSQKGRYVHEVRMGWGSGANSLGFDLICTNSAAFTGYSNVASFLKSTGHISFETAVSASGSNYVSTSGKKNMYFGAFSADGNKITVLWGAGVILEASSTTDFFKDTVRRLI